jgi:hypothetical protein
MAITDVELVRSTGLEPINKNPKELLNTGMWNERTFPYSSDEVKSTLDSLGDYRGYDYNNLFWTCHERALYGVAHARYNHPGTKIGIALGTRFDNGKELAHTLIVRWAGMNDNWVFYDPQKGEHRIEEHYFEATKLLPFPIPGLIKHAGPAPGFDQFKTVQSGCLTLVPHYDPDTKKNEVMNHLVDFTRRFSNKTTDFKIPNNVADKYPNYYLRHDRVLWECMKIRYDFQGFPLGMAFGKTTLSSGEPYDDAVLVLWVGPNKAPTYWGLGKGDLSKFEDIKFEPRIVIV